MWQSKESMSKHLEISLEDEADIKEGLADLKEGRKVRAEDKRSI